MITILNCSKHSLTCQYIVAREVDEDWWFYGAWNDFNKALEAALTAQGQVFRAGEVQCEVWG